MPSNPQQVTNAFSNDPNDRKYQDIGLDGLDDTAEVNKRQAYLAQLQGQISPAAYQRALADPSGDNYHYYRGDDLDQTAGLGLIGRYKNYNNPEGNSPVANNSTTYSTAAAFIESFAAPEASFNLFFSLISISYGSYSGVLTDCW